MNEQLEKTTQVDVMLHQWERWRKFASDLLKSEFLPQNFKTPEQVLAVVLKGKELGLPPMEALQGLYPVKGRIGISGQLMLALIYRSGELEEMKIQQIENGCRVSMKRRGHTQVVQEFGRRDAQLAGLINSTNYQKYEKYMYQWRAIAACARLAFSDILTGIYLREELEPEMVINEPEEVEAPVFNEDGVFNRLHDSLLKIVGRKDVNYQDLENWYNLNWDDVERLSGKKKDILVRMYMSSKEKGNETARLGRSESNGEIPLPD